MARQRYKGSCIWVRIICIQQNTTIVLIEKSGYSSSVNDLGTSSSDVDLCITTPWNGLRNVRVLAKLFRKCKRFDGKSNEEYLNHF